VVLLDVSKLVDYTDQFVIATGTSPPHLQAMLSELDHAAASADLKRTGAEGGKSSKWVLVDYGDVVVHLFLSESRGFYDLDGLWSDAERVEIDVEELEADESSVSAGVH
jgi:ribosome-associated protein